MPIYEYRCGACGKEHEVLQKVSERPLTKCPSCGKPKLQKMLSAAGFQLKGSGWYATDFKSKDSKPAAKKPETKTAGATTETKTETKSDAKPASTAATTD